VAQNGGKRPGAGRKKGSLNAKTLEQRAIAEAFNQRIMKQADALFNAQLSLSVGSVMVYRVDEIEDGNGKVKREHVLVTDPKEIKEVLDGNDGASGIVGESYYFVTTIHPDNRALDSMLNRGLGKPKESLDVTSNGETITATFQIATRSDG
jgi:hypothetical protein